MARGKVSSILSFIHGRVGDIVYRHDWRGTTGDLIIQSYPDMSGIIPSTDQEVKRNRFSDATLYAGVEKNNPIYLADGIERKITGYSSAISDYMTVQVFRSGLQYLETPSGPVYGPFDPSTFTANDKFKVLAKSTSPSVYQSTNFNSELLSWQGVDVNGDLTGAVSNITSSIAYSPIAENGMIGLSCEGDDVAAAWASSGDGLIFCTWETQNNPGTIAKDIGIIKDYGGSTSGITNDNPGAYSLVFNFQGKTQDYKAAHPVQLTEELHKALVWWYYYNP